MKGKFLVFVLLIVLGVVWVRYLLNSKDSNQNQQETQDDGFSNVTVIDNGNDEDDNAEQVEDESEVEETEDDEEADDLEDQTADDEGENDEVVDEDVEDESEEEENGDDEVVVGEGEEIDGANKEDGATVSSYSYNVQSGVFNFEWKVKGSADKPIPSVSASYNSDGNLIVTFPSLKADYVATEETEVDLGNQLFKVEWKPDGDGSLYEFKIGEDKGLELVANEEDGTLTLKVVL